MHRGKVPWVGRVSLGTWNQGTYRSCGPCLGLLGSAGVSVIQGPRVAGFCWESACKSLFYLRLIVFALFNLWSHLLLLHFHIPVSVYLTFLLSSIPSLPLPLTFPFPSFPSASFLCSLLNIHTLAFLFFTIFLSPWDLFFFHSFFFFFLASIPFISFS